MILASDGPGIYRLQANRVIFFLRKKNESLGFNTLIDYIIQ